MQFATLQENSAICVLRSLAALTSFVASPAFAALPDTTYESGFETCATPAQFCADVDQDNYGDIGYCLGTCEKPYDFFALPPTDCDNDSALINPGAEEICDGKDNDCDGAVDEDFPQLNTACTDGNLGICAGTGTLECDIGGTGTVCSITTPGQVPRTETCNGLDDNCDGTVDEGNPGGGAVCDTGQAGECAVGTVTCETGTLTCKANAPGCQEIQVNRTNEKRP